MKRRLALTGALLGTGLAISAAWADSWTDLRAAVYYNQEAEVVRLLDSGVDINMQNGEGWTALHVAAEQGQARMVRYLLARGADPNIETTRGRTPYDVAAGYSEVQGLLKAKMRPAQDPFGAYLGADKPAPPGGPTGGYSERSRNGPNDGRTASTRARLEARDAVWYNNKGELTAILDEGLDVNALDEAARETLLHAAAWRDRIDIAKLLLARGADRTIRDKDGKLPADYAQSPEMRALLGAAAPQRVASPAPTADNPHCKQMWREATNLCGIGATSCNTSAHIRYQACLKKGTWY